MTKKKKIVIGIIVFLSLVLIVGAIFVGRLYYIAKYNPASAFAAVSSNIETPMPTATPIVSDEIVEVAIAEPSPTEVPIEERFQQQNRVNILMLGWDRSPERDDETNPLYRDVDNNFRSDVMILLSINFETKQVDMISIPRDTYAEIYNTKGKWKINASFAKGGGVEKDSFEYAQKTVSMLFGDIPIEYYVGVDMEGLKAVVDAMGGVDYDVDVPIKLNGRELKTGMQHLDGQQVLDYCRARKGISTDVGRTDRQQRMLFAIFNQLKSKDQLKNVPAVYTSLKDKIWTNLNLTQITTLAYFSMELDTEKDLHRHTLNGEYMTAYGISFYVLYQKQKNDLCESIFGVRPEYQSKYDVNTVRKDAARSKPKPTENPPVTDEITPTDEEATESTIEETDASITAENTPGQTPEVTAETSEEMIVPTETEKVSEKTPEIKEKEESSDVVQEPQEATVENAA